MSSRIFVAGATGVLGRQIVPLLVAAGHQVTANVRSRAAAAIATEQGALCRTVDLFDDEATHALGVDHDVVVNVATAIPSGPRAVRKGAWATNDRLRTDAARGLASSMAATHGRYIGESITFPYVDAGDEWIEEDRDRSCVPATATSVNAEAAAASVTAGGGVGVALRFAMFFSADSAHTAETLSMAARGLCGLTGQPDAYVSLVHVDDAAAAVVAALGAPAGVYNVAEATPSRRSEHAEALARAVGRRKVRQVAPWLQRMGGSGLETVSRSHRISSGSLAASTGWEPTVAVVERWGD
ncbi:MAG: NAD-dependent epimerase/dehydratase family protein [Ilumatobacter sp.]